MKPVQEIRREIEKILGAMVRTPTELGMEDELEGRVRPQTIWNETSSQAEKLDLSNIEEATSDPDTDAIPEIEELLEFGAEIDTGAIKRGLGGKIGEEIRRSVLQKGVEALAFYCSFHQIGTQWGIYVPVTSLVYLSFTVFDKLPVDFNTKLLLSFRMLHQHELFHFAVDYMVSQCEGVLEKPCYVTARKRLRDEVAGYILLEEELANAHMIRAMRGGRSHMRVKNRTELLRQFVKQQPAGYKDGGRSTSETVFTNRSTELAREHLRCIDGYVAKYLNGVDLFRLFPIDRTINWRYCPIHVIHDEARLAVSPISIGLFQRVAGIQETEAFVQRFEFLPGTIKGKWHQTKRKLAQTTALRGLDFKPWRNGPDGRIYSVRVSHNYRAHLEYIAPSWLAIEIGTHKEMGHG